MPPSLCPRGHELRLNWYELSAACHRMDDEMARMMYRAHLRECPECSEYIREMFTLLRTRPATAFERAEGVTIGITEEMETEHEVFHIT